MLTAQSPEILEFLKAWHENGRASFERDYKNLNYDRDQEKHAIERKKYIALDNGSSGRFLVDRLTHRVFTIKAYGVKNYDCGTLESLTMRYLEAIATRRVA